MNSALNKNLFFVKEHVKIFKAANSFDVFDPDTKQIVLECREENLGFFTKMFRFTEYSSGRTSSLPSCITRSAFP